MILPGFTDSHIGTVGDSAFEVTLTNPLVTVTGYLADSNQVTTTSQPCNNGFVPLYQPLYTSPTSTNGLLIGWLSFSGVNANATNTGSELIWLSEAGATTRYPIGFTNEAAPVLSAFAASQAQLLPINVGYIQMSGAGLNAPIVEPMRHCEQPDHRYLAEPR